MNPERLKELLEEAYDRFKGVGSGKLPSYIPELQNVDPNDFAITVTTTDGNSISVGDYQKAFTLQSLSKPFVFGMALEICGLKRLRSRVDVEPTGDSFNSVIRLGTESKKPYNPMINTGAISMTDLIGQGSLQERQEVLFHRLGLFTGEKVTVNERVFESEQKTGHRNKAIAYLMLHFRMINPGLDDTLDLYYKQCSINVTSESLAMMAATLANNGVNPRTQEVALKKNYVKYVLSIMFTCGLYTDAGEWAFDVGIPAKSGVSGGIFAVIPGMMGIGVYSPPLDSHGNSVRARKVCEFLSKKLDLHVFQHR